jgi:hypothetical protein
MRKYLLPLLAIAVLASCSAPKYAYQFDHYDYNSGKKKSDVAAMQTPAENQVAAEKSPLALQEETMVASAEEKAVVLAETPTIEAQREAVAKKYAAMSKTERKAFRKEAKTQVKAYIKAVKSGDKAQVAEAAQRMDHDLKLAAIFGAVGIVSLLIGGDVFWVIGGIALIIGVVFFVMWLTRQ